MGITTHAHFALTDFARQDDPDELVIPDDLTTLDQDDLTALHDRAVAAFDAIFNGGDVSEDDLGQLQSLTDGIAGLRDEITRRADEKAARTEKATELAAQVNPAEPADEADADAEDCEDCDTDDGEVVAEVDADTGEVTNVDEATVAVPDDASEITENQPEPVAASAAKAVKKRNTTRINLSGIRSSQARTPRPTTQPQTMADVVTAAPDMPGFANGQGMTWSDIGRGIDRRLTGFNVNQFARAAREGRSVRQQYSVAAIRRPFDDALVVHSDDPGHVDTVIQHAVNEARLPGGSLVASGGWCAPSDTVYDLCQLESRDGMLTIPEIQVSRGGIRLATGPDFASLYTDTGFCYTEQEDIDGDYDGDGGGSKPCYTVDCPDFTDYRMNVCGTCISAGLLQAHGYPEAIARTTSGALIAHEHRVNSKIIQSLVDGSTVVDYPAPQEGATAPLLSAIEMQVELVKQRERMSRGTSMEGVFPYWITGVIRADLSRRLGVDLIDVPDARINAWFTQRGISPQYVYDWQDLPDDAVAYPDSVDVLLYPAGAWVKGASDIISLDTIYDSTMLGTNDYTALFFEEGWLVAPQCGESRAVTVPLCPSGSTHSGALIGCDGTGSGSAS